MRMMADGMLAAGFRLLPAIQGAPGTALRQTATMAATMDTPVLEADGRIGNAQNERQFVEIIERAQARDDDGALLWTADGEPLIFRNFLRSEEHTSELQSLMRISYDVFCLKK